MSEYDETPKPTESEQFDRMFAKFMRNSFAQSGTKQMIPIKPPEISHKVDTQPLVLSLKLNGENYQLWAVLMQAAINGRGMMSHITGVPSPPPKTEPEFAQWQQADHCVFTWLVQNIEPKLVNRVSRYPTAKGVWDSLAVTYASGGDKIQVYDLHRKATLLKLKDEALKDVWASLQDIWVAIDQKRPNPMESPKDIETFNEYIEEQRLFQFLMALNDKHEAIKKEILRSETLPSVETVYAMVRREEARVNIFREETSNTETSQGIGAGLAVRRPWQGQNSH